MLSSRAAQRARGWGWAAMLLGACAGARGVPPAASPSEVATYDTLERPDPVRGAADPAAYMRAIAFAARDAGGAPRGDGRLARLARDCARAGGCDPRELGRRARALGLVDAQLALHEVRAASADLLPAALASELGAPLRALAATHVGVFVDESRVRAIAVLSRRPLALAPLPRRIGAGEALRLRGRLAGRFEDTVLWVFGPAGAQSLPAGAGPDFDMQVALPQTGCYELVLSAREGDRTQTLAKLTAYAGTDVPADDCAVAPARLDGPQLEADLAQRVAALRSANHLPPLTADPALAERARRPSVTPTTREQAAGLWLRAQAQGRDAEALWQVLTRSAAGRSALLHPEATHFGFAVRVADDGWVADVITARELRLADLELVPARVLEALNQNRAARDAAALRPDPILSEAAGRAARAFFAQPGQSEREIITRTNAELERFGLSYRRIAALSLLVVDPLEAAALEPALDPDARAVGIAAAAGTRPGAQVRSLVVVIALGWER